MAQPARVMCGDSHSVPGNLPSPLAYASICRAIFHRCRNLYTYIIRPLRLARLDNNNEPTTHKSRSRLCVRSATKISKGSNSVSKDTFLAQVLP